MAELHNVHEMQPLDDWREEDRREEDRGEAGAGGEDRREEERREGWADRSVPDLSRMWQPELVVGAISLALGIVVALHPTTSLNVVSVLLGVLLLLTGVLYVIRAIGGDARRRGWAALAGLAFVVLGVVLVRHLNVTVLLIALLVGLTWIVQGVVELVGASVERGATRTWLVVFGAVSLAGGIVVIAVPIGSVTVLTVLLGIWWIVMGLFEVAEALVMRHAMREVAPPSDQAATGASPEGRDRDTSVRR